jgi:hypothetical protein
MMNDQDSKLASNSISHAADMARYAAIECFDVIANEWTRPSVVYRPRIAQDGNAWIACLGDNLAEGVVGCGETPALAMQAFDNAWTEKAVVR